jgi:hypothetical protein
MYLDYPTNSEEIPANEDFGYFVEIRLVGTRKSGGGNKTQGYNVSYVVNTNTGTTDFDAGGQRWFEFTPSGVGASLLTDCTVTVAASKLRINLTPAFVDVIHWTAVVEVIEAKGFT